MCVCVYASMFSCESVYVYLLMSKHLCLGVCARVRLCLRILLTEVVICDRTFLLSDIFMEWHEFLSKAQLRDNSHL